MIKSDVLPTFWVAFIVLHNLCKGGEGLLEQEKMLKNYECAETNAIINIVRRDLLSKDNLVQDAGCIILLKSLERLEAGDGKAQAIFARLSEDEKIIAYAADIIDSRLLGWYNNEKSEGNDDNLKIYKPLFYILAKADNKTARGTLVRSFLYIRGRKDILEGIPMSEDVFALSLKKLKIIKEKLCCLYPGRDFVVEMLEKDSRFAMLDMFEALLGTNRKPSEQMKNAIKEFIITCMEYGDAKNGCLIRIKAIKIAGILIKCGETQVTRKIEDLSKNDPYYIHKFDGESGYSLTELEYPVRKICSEILLR